MPLYLEAIQKFRSVDFKGVKRCDAEVSWLGPDSARQMLPSTQNLMLRPAAEATETAEATEH
ncbi:hypothetical protein FJZ31_20095 [Candidatus Poribacteria bacterium]|nr:hypothetical protein [Candidatus Poribacteria bacterium]